MCPVNLIDEKPKKKKQNYECSNEKFLYLDVHSEEDEIQLTDTKENVTDTQPLAGGGTSQDESDLQSENQQSATQSPLRGLGKERNVIRQSLYRVIFLSRDSG